MLGTPGYAGGTPAHAGVAWFTLRNAWASLGNACSRWGRLVHAGERLGHAGERLLTLGTPGYAGRCLGHAGERLAHAGDAWLRWEMPGSRWGSAWCHTRLGSLLGCWCTRGPLCLLSVIKVKYASRGPPYIAGSEPLCRVFWCESQLLIGSSRSMSIRETPECLGCFDVRYTFNPCCIIGMCGMCHPKFTAQLSRASGGQAP